MAQLISILRDKELFLKTMVVGQIYLFFPQIVVDPKQVVSGNWRNLEDNSLSGGVYLGFDEQRQSLRFSEFMIAPCSRLAVEFLVPANTKVTLRGY